MESMVAMDEQSFNTYFGEERNWTCRLSNGMQVVPLKPGGAEIGLAYSDRLEYARLVQETRMNESKEQVISWLILTECLYYFEWFLFVITHKYVYSRSLASTHL